METSRSQSSRREAGSIPELGSSRNTTGASPSRAVATQSRRFCPPLRSLQRECRFSRRPRARSTSSVSPATLADPRRRAKKRRCSSTESFSYMGLSCGHTDKFKRACSNDVDTGWSYTKASPDVNGIMPMMQFMAVVLPAPLWPNKAKISPQRTSRDMSSTATKACPLRTNSLRSRRSSRAQSPRCMRASSSSCSSSAAAGRGGGRASRRRGQTYRGIRQKSFGLAAPKSPCHTWSNQ
mmetsp:Transcript_1777/g.5222  ORF Transcript_1777/g.5222 Transcript_1777/m.5222 type:complete len:238 (+) Transcript_1777:1457-2170(+)